MIAALRCTCAAVAVRKSVTKARTRSAPYAESSGAKSRCGRAVSGAKAVTYTVEQLAAMEEASNLARERARFEVATVELSRLEAEATQFREHYGEQVVTPRTPAVSSRATSEELRRATDSFEGAIADARARLAGIRDRERQKRLAQRLGELLGDRVDAAPPVAKSARAATSRVVDAASTPAHPEREAPASRVRRYLDQLDSGLELSEAFLELADTLAREVGEDKAQLAADALQEEVGRLNREGRKRRRVRAAINDLQVRVGALAAPPAGLQRAIDAADAAHERLESVDLGPIEKAVAVAESEARSTQEAAYVRDVLSDILRDQGYEQVGGFETVIAEHGLLVRKSDWSEHGLLVRVDDEELDLRVVRTVADTDTAGARDRDVATETEFCADLPTMLDEFGERGIRTQIRRHVSPDVLKVSTLEGAPAVMKPAAKRSTRRAQPKAKRL